MTLHKLIIIETYKMQDLQELQKWKHSCDEKSFFYIKVIMQDILQLLHVLHVLQIMAKFGFHAILSPPLSCTPSHHPIHHTLPTHSYLSLLCQKKTRLGGQWTQGQDLPQASLQVYCCKQKQQEKEENNGCGIPWP